MRDSLPSAAVLALVLGCSTPGSGRLPDSNGASTLAADATGAMSWRKGDKVVRQAEFGPARVASGEAGGPATSYLDRTAAGTWKGGLSRTDGRDYFALEPVELVVSGNRITGPSVDVRVTRSPGGMRIEGLWLRTNVTLDVTATTAKAKGETWRRDASGAYVNSIGWTITLRDAANRLEEAPWPQLALMFLMFGWGVDGAL